MLRSFHYAPGFDGPHRDTGPTGRSTRPFASSFLQAVAALRTTCDVWRESLAACRQYEQLRSSGVSYDLAVREALGIGAIPSQSRREAKTCCAVPQQRRIRT